MILTKLVVRTYIACGVCMSSVLFLSLFLFISCPVASWTHLIVYPQCDRLYGLSEVNCTCALHLSWYQLLMSANNQLNSPIYERIQQQKLLHFQFCVKPMTTKAKKEHSSVCTCKGKSIKRMCHESWTWAKSFLFSFHFISLQEKEPYFSWFSIKWQSR